MKVNPDAHGQAALMLCESLLFILLESGVIRKDQLGEAIDGIIALKTEMAGTSESVVVSLTSIRLLRAIAQSISAAPESQLVSAS